MDLEETSTNLANLTLLGDSSTSVVIGGLLAGTTYSIRAAAWTSAGLGPASAVKTFHMVSVPASEIAVASIPREEYPIDPYGTFGDPSSGITSDVTQVVQQPWFIFLLGGLFLAALVMLIAVLMVRGRIAKKKAMTSSVQKSDPHCSSQDRADSVNGQVRGRDLWSRGWHSATTASTTKEAELEVKTSLLPQYANSIVRCGVPPPEYAELMNQNQDHHGSGHLSLSSFLPRKAANMHPPSAYATTTLVAAPSARSHGSYLGSANLKSDSSSCSYTTDENNASRSSCRKSQEGRRHRNENSGGHHQQIPNWADMLPPPPRHPPPPSPAPTNDRQQQLQIASSVAGPSPALSKRSAPASCTAYGLKSPHLYNATLTRNHNGSASSAGSVCLPRKEAAGPHSKHGGSRSWESNADAAAAATKQDFKAALAEPANSVHADEVNARQQAAHFQQFTRQQQQQMTNDYSEADSYYAVGTPVMSAPYDNRVDNNTSEWDEDYSQSISGPNSVSDGHASDSDDMVSSVYDNMNNSPCVFRTPNKRLVNSDQRDT